jgi:hypothetical protein
VWAFEAVKTSCTLLTMGQQSLLHFVENSILCQCRPHPVLHNASKGTVFCKNVLTVDFFAQEKFTASNTLIGLSKQKKRLKSTPGKVYSGLPAGDRMCEEWASRGIAGGVHVQSRETTRWPQFAVR